MLVAVLTTIGNLDYAMTTPGQCDRYTEFYLYSDNPSGPYFDEPLHICIDVRRPPLVERCDPRAEPGFAT